MNIRLNNEEYSEQNLHEIFQRGREEVDQHGIGHRGIVMRCIDIAEAAIESMIRMMEAIDS